MRYLLLFFIFFTLSATAQIPGSGMHCGYDFTSYFVLDVHESGKSENIKGLKITIIDSLGNDVVNINNAYSWKNANKPLQFYLNYKIDDNNQKVAEGKATGKERWFFPFAKDNYLISVANTFPAEKFSVKVQDVDGQENGGSYKTVILPLYSYNMYILCSSETQQAAMKFGRKMNRPIDIVLEKE
jgi:hypothetical protein